MEEKWTVFSLNLGVRPQTPDTMSFPSREAALEHCHSTKKMAASARSDCNKWCGGRRSLAGRAMAHQSAEPKRCH
jgi:hypothetical protein